jgi:hypothetical protein
MQGKLNDALQQLAVFEGMGADGTRVAHRPPIRVEPVLPQFLRDPGRRLHHKAPVGTL